MQFPLFSDSSTSLVSRFLTREIFDELKDKKTKNQFSLKDAISSAVANPDSHIGIYAGDVESYGIFKPLLEPIILEYHNVKQHIQHTSLLQPVEIPNPDPEGVFIRSTRIRTARNLMGYSFTPQITLDKRKEVEHTILSTLHGFDDELSGRYFSLSEKISNSEKNKHLQEGLAFVKGDRFQEAAGINKDFPHCRGVFCSDNKKFRVWINEEDHMRIISQDKSGDIGAVFNRLIHGLHSMKKNLTFASHPQYGYLSTCPTNIGTGMRAGVHIHLPKLDREPEKLNQLTVKHNLQVRGSKGEKTDVVNALYDISNTQRLGIKEPEIATALFHGITEIIEVEKKL